MVTVVSAWESIPIGPVFSTGLFDRHCIFLDVLFRGRRVGGAADVVECFGVLNAERLAQSAAAREDELADVVAVGRDVVVAEERQLLTALGEFGSEPRA